MLHKCASPDCDSQYRYFREGLLFEFQVDRDNNYLPLTLLAPGGARREMFWLCKQCSGRLTMECRNGTVSVVPTTSNRKTA